jgi:hypothetical protein
MSDTSQGPGWWEASDERWYPPEDDLIVSPGWHQGELGEWLPPTGSGGGAPGWWVSVNGDWYPPERHPTPNPRAEMPDEDNPSNGPGRSSASVAMHASEGVSASVPGSPIDSHVEVSTAASSPNLNPARGSCTNGHEMDESDNFCPVCGSRRSGNGLDVGPAIVASTKSDTRPLGKRQKMARDPKTQPDVLDRLACDDDWIVRYEVAKNPSTSHSAKAVLMQDEVSVIRGAVIRGEAEERQATQNEPWTESASTQLLRPPRASDNSNRTAAMILGVIVVAVLLAVIIATSSGGKSQSYKDGWNTAVDPTQTVDCNNWIAPNGDNQDDWVQGCNDGSNAANAAYDSGSTPPTTYP